MLKHQVMIILLALALPLATACGKDKKKKTTPDSGDETAVKDTTKNTSKPPKVAKTEEATGELREALISLRRVHFPYDSSTLVPASRDALSDAAEKLARHPKVAIYVQGHADARGTTEYNVALGDRRGQIVADYLRRAGVAGDRLKVVSYGEEQPLDASDSANARAKNRRVDFKLIRGDVQLTVEEGGVVDDAGSPITSEEKKD